MAKKSFLSKLRGESLSKLDEEERLRKELIDWIHSNNFGSWIST